MTNSTSLPLTLCELTETGLPGVESFSPFCLKVHRALAYAGLAFTSRRASDPREFRRYNATGQVPVLLIGEESVKDSTAILTRIEALVPGIFDRGLDVRGRAEALLWEELADTSLNGFLVAARWADTRNWDGVRAAYFGGAPWFVGALIAPRIRAKVKGGLVARDVWRAGAEACWERFSATLDALESRAPELGFWLGSSLSRADLAIFAQLHSLRTHLTVWQRDQVAARPRLRAYLDRVHQETRAPRSDFGLELLEKSAHRVHAAAS